MTYQVVGVVAILVLLVASDLSIRMTKRRRLERLASRVAEMRRLATQATRRRPVGPEDARLAAPHDLLEAVERELSEQGLLVLGDLVEERPDGSPAGITRWFVDPGRTVCGWFGVARTRESGAINPIMMLFSEADSGEFFVTGRGASSRTLARPPSVHRTFLGWSDGLARVLEQHRAHVAQGASGGGAALRRVERIDEAVALLGRMRESTARWRASQPPAALLEEDVRLVLQERSEDLGPHLVRLMRSRGY